MYSARKRPGPLLLMGHGHVSGTLNKKPRRSRCGSVSRGKNRRARASASSEGYNSSQCPRFDKGTVQTLTRQFLLTFNSGLPFVCSEMLALVEPWLKSSASVGVNDDKDIDADADADADAGGHVVEDAKAKADDDDDGFGAELDMEPSDTASSTSALTREEASEMVESEYPEGSRDGKNSERSSQRLSLSPASIFDFDVFATKAAEDKNDDGSGDNTGSSSSTQGFQLKERYAVYALLYCACAFVQTREYEDASTKKFLQLAARCLERCVDHVSPLVARAYCALELTHLVCPVSCHAQSYKKKKKKTSQLSMEGRGVGVGESGSNSNSNSSSSSSSSSVSAGVSDSDSNAKTKASFLHPCERILAQCTAAEKSAEMHHTFFLLGIAYSWMELCEGQDSSGRSILDQDRHSNAKSTPELLAPISLPMEASSLQAALMETLGGGLPLPLSTESTDSASTASNTANAVEEWPLSRAGLARSNSMGFHSSSADLQQHAAMAALQCRQADIAHLASLAKDSPSTSKNDLCTLGSVDIQADSVPTCTTIGNVPLEQICSHVASKVAFRETQPESNLTSASTAGASATSSGSATATATDKSALPQLVYYANFKMMYWHRRQRQAAAAAAAAGASSPTAHSARVRASVSVSVADDPLPQQHVSASASGFNRSGPVNDSKEYRMDAAKATTLLEETRVSDENSSSKIETTSLTATAAEILQNKTDKQEYCLQHPFAYVFLKFSASMHHYSAVIAEYESYSNSNTPTNSRRNSISSSTNSDDSSADKSATSSVQDYKSLHHQQQESLSAVQAEFRSCASYLMNRPELICTPQVVYLAVTIDQMLGNVQLLLMQLQPSGTASNLASGQVNADASNSNSSASGSSMTSGSGSGCGSSGVPTMVRSQSMEKMLTTMSQDTQAAVFTKTESGGCSSKESARASGSRSPNVTSEILQANAKSRASPLLLPYQPTNRYGYGSGHQHNLHSSFLGPGSKSVCISDGTVAPEQLTDYWRNLSFIEPLRVNAKRRCTQFPNAMLLTNQLCAVMDLAGEMVEVGASDPVAIVPPGAHSGMQDHGFSPSDYLKEFSAIDAASSYPSRGSIYCHSGQSSSYSSSYQHHRAGLSSGLIGKGRAMGIALLDSGSGTTIEKPRPVKKKALSTTRVTRAVGRPRRVWGVLSGGVPGFVGQTAAPVPVPVPASVPAAAPAPTSAPVLNTVPKHSCPTLSVTKGSKLNPNLAIVAGSDSGIELLSPDQEMTVYAKSFSSENLQKCEKVATHVFTDSPSESESASASTLISPVVAVPTAAVAVAAAAAAAASSGAKRAYPSLSVSLSEKRAKTESIDASVDGSCWEFWDPATDEFEWVDRLPTGTPNKVTENKTHSKPPCQPQAHLMTSAKNVVSPLAMSLVQQQSRREYSKGLD